MRCAECSTSNPLSHKFCRECGSRLDDGYRTLLREARAAEIPAEDQKAERLTQLLDMAFWHNESGNLDAAVKACEAALSLHADNTTAHSLLGTLYEKKGDDATAITHFERVVSLNPDSAADAQKLDQLTRGVHVKAAAPPPVHKWIPPALASLALTPRPPLPQVGEWEQSKRRPRWVPLVGASCAAALVLGIGLSAMRGQPPGTGSPTPASYNSATPPSEGGGENATSSAPSAPPSLRGLASERGKGDGGLGTLPPPVTLAPGQSTGRALSDIFPPPPYGKPQAAPDPFASRVADNGIPRSALGGNWKQHNSLYLPPNLGGRGGLSKTRTTLYALPPLSLKAVPLPGDTLAPAPVDVPAAVPQHTVVVSNLGGAGLPPPRIGGPGGPSSAASSPSPHIQITVHSGADSDGGIALSGNGAQITTTYTPAALPDAARLQQSALSAQQSGNYKQARSWYEQAIRAYRAQISAGRDPDTARAGLSACQTGLAICQQTPL